MVFSAKEIEQSIEYRWRIYQIKSYLSLWGVLSAATFLVVPFSSINGNLDALPIAFFVWLGLNVFLGVFLGCVSLINFSKAIYLKRLFPNFTVHEVVLDKPSTSFLYPRAVYYTVVLTINGQSFETQTNPYFSSATFSKFTLNDYNNSKVVGLYDEVKGKFYIIKKI